MAKKNQQKKQGNPKQELILRKESEKKSWKGKWITFSATAKENGKPLINKQITFFLNNHQIADAETDTNGYAKHTLILKGGMHNITAKMREVQSNSITVTIQKKQEDIEIVSRQTKLGKGYYRIYFEVFKDGNPFPGAVLRITKGGKKDPDDLRPTNSVGQTDCRITFKASEDVFLVRLLGSETTVWKNLFR